MEPQPGGPACRSPPFLSSPSKAGEHGQHGSPVPPPQRGWVCWWAAAPQSARQGGQQAELHGRGAPGLQPAPHTNMHEPALQGEIMFEAHCAFLKLQTLEVTCFSFAPCFPSHTARAASISSISISATARPGDSAAKELGRTVTC